MEAGLGQIRQTEYAERRLRQLVTIRIELGDVLGAKRAAGAGFVLDDDAMVAKRPAERLGERPEYGIGRSARLPGTDQADRAVGIRIGWRALRQGACACPERGRDRCQCQRREAFAPLPTRDR